MSTPTYYTQALTLLSKRLREDGYPDAARQVAATIDALPERPSTD